MCSTRARLMILLAAGLLVSVSSPAQAAPGDIIKLGPGGDPQWSPDGKTIAFLYDGAVYAVNANGSGTRSKVMDGPVRRFVWASDSSLVFTYDQRRGRKSDTVTFFNVTIARDTGMGGFGVLRSLGPQELVMAVGGGMVRTVITGPWRLGDGTVGYFRCLGSPLGPAEFEPMRFGSSDTTRWRSSKRVITREPGTPYSPLWGDIWLVRTDTMSSQGRQLTSGEEFGMVSMSPSGDRFAALSTKRDAWVIMDTTGSELISQFGTRVIGKDRLMRGVTDIVWSPDGEKFTYLGLVEDADTTVAETLWLYSMRDAKSSMVVSDEHGGLDRPSWSPNGTALAVPAGTSGILVVEVK